MMTKRNDLINNNLNFILIHLNIIHIVKAGETSWRWNWQHLGVYAALKSKSGEDLRVVHWEIEFFLAVNLGRTFAISSSARVFSQQEFFLFLFFPNMSNLLICFYYRGGIYPHYGFRNQCSQDLVRCDEWVALFHLAVPFEKELLS